MSLSEKRCYFKDGVRLYDRRAKVQGNAAETRRFSQSNYIYYLSEKKCIFCSDYLLLKIFGTLYK